MFDAFLDIETTGLSCQYADITVIGIYLVKGKKNKLVQLGGKLSRVFYDTQHER